ncbi:MAG TPA: NUDIX hydrolase [Candidatus Subteraquimicrobiales bacterium]
MTDYKFCPRCKTELRVLYEDEYKRLVCPECDFIYYYNSKPTASAVIEDGNRVLLCRRNIEPRKNYWDLPGGFLEAGEHPEEGAKREIKEELEVEIDILDTLGIFMDSYESSESLSTLNIYYLAKIKSGKLRMASEINEIKWFDRDNLPKEMAFKSNTEALSAWRARKTPKKNFGRRNDF